MKLTMKKTAVAAFVALILTGCGSSSHNPSQPNNPRQHSQPTPTVKAIDYSKQTVQQLEQSVAQAKNVVTESQNKVKKVETQISELNNRITHINQEILRLEKAPKTDAKTLQDKRNELANVNKELAVQNKVLIVAQQDVKQAQLNLTNVQNILVEKKAEQNKPPVVVVPNQPSQPSQPTQPNEPAQPSEPEQPSPPNIQGQAQQPAQPSTPAPATPAIPPIAEGERIINIHGDSKVKDYFSVSSIFGENSNKDLARKINNDDVEIDLSNFSNYQQGVYQGVFTHPDLIVKDGTGKNQINYMFVNQPYSSYGILMTNETDMAERDFTRFAIAVYPDNYFVSPKGTAKYKGEVLARFETVLTDYSKPADERVSRHTVYQKDGTVELTANFDRKRISGYLNSDAIGQVRLSETDLPYRHYKGKTLENTTLEQGEYKGDFSYNDQDTVGHIDIKLKEVKTGDIEKEGSYHAVFGATKQ